MQALDNLLIKIEGIIEKVHEDHTDEKTMVERRLQEQRDEENDLEWEIEELKKRVKAAREREVSMLETVENLTAQLEVRQAKSSSYLLMRKQNHDFFDEEEMKKNFRLEYETRLNNKILDNTKLKK